MRQGFSLVELSIVLVILGLLTGGILAGQSLIRASQLRAVTTEHDRYVAAVQTFRDKYFALPGDMTNATKFWGAADGGDGIGFDCRGAETADIRTCNGNGDGRIGGALRMSVDSSWEGEIHAKHGIIAGRVTGKLVIGEKLEVGASAVIHADVVARSVAIAQGAVIQGEVTVTTGEAVLHFEEKRKS